MNMRPGSQLVNDQNRDGQPSQEPLPHPIDDTMYSRSSETTLLLESLIPRLATFLAKADAETRSHQQNVTLSERSSLIPAESLLPKTLTAKIKPSLQLPGTGTGHNGLLATINDILQFSVNTFCPGFMDKLYGSPLPPGIAAELVLAVLNTNVHVYQVSPVLTLIEKHVTKSLANMFGFHGPRAGGVSVQGGSASNLTSIVAARNCIFPRTKIEGNMAENNGKLSLFTSAHGHYSIEKAAQALGFGSQNVIAVPVDRQGKMLPDQLDRLITESKSLGFTPFYINATAGSTVLGSFDPFDEIAAVARKHRCWLHVDGAWGGSFVFANRKEMKNRLQGMEKADSVAVNPHKMLGVPMTCSFLLTRDLRLFQTAMTLKAGYLFHDVEGDDLHSPNGTNDENRESKDLNSMDDSMDQNILDSTTAEDDASPWSEPYDIADLTLQCGRRGDSLKLFMSWQYYGTDGYRAKVESAYDIALEFAALIDDSQDFTLVLGEGSRPECLQVCFYYTPGGKLVFGQDDSQVHPSRTKDDTQAKTANDISRKRHIGKLNSLVTSRMSRDLISRGFMIDYAPALGGQEEKGSFFRVVVNISTIRETIYRLVNELRDVGNIVVREMREKYS